MAPEFFTRLSGGGSGLKSRSVFRGIDTPRSAVFAEYLEENVASLIACFAAISVLWAVVASAAGVDAMARDAPIPQLLHVSVVSLVFGVGLLPLRMILVPLGIFLLSFVSGQIAVALLDPYQPFNLHLSLTGLVVNLLVGTVSGLIGKGFYHTLQNKNLNPPSEAWVAAVLCIAFAVIGFIVTLALVDHAANLANVMNPTFGKFEIFQRAFQLSLLSAGLYLLFLDSPSVPHLREAILFAPIFIAKAVLTNFSYDLYGALDPTLIGIFILLVRPIYPAIASVLLGFVLYIAMTGQFALQTLTMTPEVLRLEITSSLAMVMMLVIAIVRVGAHAMVKRQYETLGRLSRAQELSQVGYFVVDVDQKLAQLDEVAQQILGCRPEFHTREFVQRTHPEDRPLLAATAQPTGPSQAVSLRFNREGPWTEGCVQHTISIFLRYEKLWDDRFIGYGVVVDVTQEHMEENHLREVLAELSERQSRQTKLFSIISHELRSPATMLAMLLDEMDDGGTWEVFGPQMRAVTEQMMSVLRDMRQTDRPEQNPHIYLEPFRPQHVAEAVRNSFRILAKKKGIRIDLRLAGDALHDRITDRARLTQAISNIVSNAIVHSRATIITIAYREEKNDSGLVGHWRIWDNGRNLPERVRNRLFDAVPRDGAGLGLLIARSTMQLLGGDIVYVHRPNSGATFEITLPMTVPESGGDAMAKPLFIKAEDEAEFKKMHVLLVEDSPMTGSLMAARMGRSFGTVEWVSGGLPAMEAVARKQPDLIVTDLFMPDLGGDGLAHSLRRQGNKVPIIGMTATNVGEDITRFRASGADEVLTKPVRMDRLLDAVERVIARVGSDNHESVAK